MAVSLLDLLTIPNVVAWLLIVGAVGFAAMGVDKSMARSNWGERISEKTLWLTAISGGFLGIIAGAITFHHKTSKRGFWPPVGFAVFFWALLLALIASGHAN
jgi:uncharacterized membrane protein YsdA (DUF1294 family)